jgi:hypothetical protein
MLPRTGCHADLGFLASLTTCPRLSPAKVNREIIAREIIARERTLNELPTVKLEHHTKGRASNALYDHLQRIQ